MSGEKCSRIEVADSTRLFDAVRDAYRSLKEKREREAREREQRALDEAKQQWSAVMTDLAAVRSQSSGIENEFPDVHFPDPPHLELQKQDDAAAVLQDVAEAERKVALYRQELNEAVISARCDRAAREGRDSILEWYRAQAAGTAGGAAVGLPNDETWRGQQARDRELRQTTFEQAQELMSKLDGRITRTPAKIGQLLEAVGAATSRSDAMLMRNRLKTEVDLALEEVERRERQRKKAMEAMKLDRVAELMARSLEDMGYAVSGIEETAYVEDGHIIAYRPERPGHAVRLVVDRDTSEVTSNVVKLVESRKDALPGAMDQEDREADDDWCNPDGIGRLARSLAAKGVSVHFTKASTGQERIQAVAIDDLLEASPSLADHFEREDGQLRQRAHPVEDR